MSSDRRTRLEALYRSHAELLEAVREELTDELLEAVELVVDVLRHGRKILLCGNGGSAADAQHFAAELVGSFGGEGRALPAVALTVDSSVLTALGNDLGFEEVFSRQVEALGRAGDLLVAISTSGASPNVLEALTTARRRGLRTLALTGAEGGARLGEVESLLAVPSRDTQRIQEMHSLLLHALGELVVEAIE